MTTLKVLNLTNTMKFGLKANFHDVNDKVTVYFRFSFFLSEDFSLNVVIT